MKHVFYALTFIFLLQEITVFANPKKWHNFVTKRLKDIKEGDEDYYKKVSLALFGLFYMIWAFVGLFSFQWWAFLFLFSISLIPKKWMWYRWIDALISIVILFFIVVNAYHLHISL